jgi:lipid-A-disaccharide synthase
MKVALVAGEASGDILGAALIRALRDRYPQASFYGVAGPRMRAAGCEAVESIEALSVMGLAEVVRHLPRLARLRGALVDRFAGDRPDVFIGVDAPDFNLGLERRLKARGIRTVHLVSPTVWAWRPGRVHGVGQATDLLLCLYPFEPQIYAAHGIRAAYVGHPLADELDDSGTATDARRRLGLSEEGPLVAVLPGSRAAELRYLAEPFAAAAAWLAQRLPALRFVVPIAHPDLRAPFEQAMARHPGPQWQLLDGHSRLAMQAADAVLLASGTATLECLLLGRPMVVGYRGAALTAFLMLKAGLLQIDHVSLPNILAAEAVVPELLQGDLTAERLGQEMYCLLRHAVLRERQLAQFAAVRRELKRNSADRAAEAVHNMLGGER